MIEMLGVLAIIGVLSVGGIAGYSKAMMKYRINKAIEQITLIAGNVRTFFAPQKSYDGLDNYAVIRKAKLVPEEMWTYYDSDQPWGAKAGDFKGFTNVFGASFDLGYKDKSKTGDKQAFSLLYGVGDNLEACIELVSQDWSNSNIGFIQLGGSGPISAKYLKTPVIIDTAISSCSDMIEKIKSHSDWLLFSVIVFYFDVDLNSEVWKNITWEN